MKKFNRIHAGMVDLIMARYIEVRYISWSGNTHYQYNKEETEIFNQYYYIRNDIRHEALILESDDTEYSIELKATKNILNDIDTLFDGDSGFQGSSPRHSVDSILFGIKSYVDDELSDVETIIDIFYRNLSLRPFEKDIINEIYFKYVDDNIDVSLADVLASLKVVREELSDNSEKINEIYADFMNILY